MRLFRTHPTATVSERRHPPGSPLGPIDLGPTIRVVAYVPQLVLVQFDEVAAQQDLSRSAAIADAMSWWHVRKRSWAIRGAKARLTPEQLQAEREARDLDLWRGLMADTQR